MPAPTPLRPALLLYSRFARVDPPSWIELSADERDRRWLDWSRRLGEALARLEPFSILESFEWASDAIYIGDLESLRLIADKPVAPMLWRGERAHCPSSQSELEGYSGQPILLAAWLALCGDSRWLDALLPNASPLAKIKALELCAGQPGRPEAFERVFRSIAIAPEPEGGWVDAKRLAKLEAPHQARSLKDARLWCEIFPFGLAFESAAQSGFLPALRWMGEALGPQSRQGARPDRLRARRYFPRCCQSSPDPVAAILIAMDYADPQDTAAGLALLTGPGAALGDARGERPAIVAAVNARLEANALKAHLRPEAPMPPSRPAPRV